MKQILLSTKSLVLSLTMFWNYFFIFNIWQEELEHNVNNKEVVIDFEYFETKLKFLNLLKKEKYIEEIDFIQFEEAFKKIKLQNEIEIDFNESNKIFNEKELFNILNIIWLKEGKIKKTIA